MSRLLLPGRWMFAISIIALGVLSFIQGDFIIGRPPIEIPGQITWAWMLGIAIILCGIAIIAKYRAGYAALTTGFIVLVFSFFSRQFPWLFKVPGDTVLWAINSYKTLAIAGSSFIVAASFFKEEGRNINSILTNERLIWAGIIFLSYFFIICGFAHFRFDDFIINDFMPKYIPFPAFWTYFCGITLMAGGVGILLPATRRLAAFLSGVMIFGWIVLVHIPIFFTNTTDLGNRLGLPEPLLLTGAFFVLAAIPVKHKAPGRLTTAF